MIQQKLVGLINELYRSFDFFNKHFCDNELKTPLITIQGDNSCTKLGWYGHNFWYKDKNQEDHLSELNLVAETLSREPKDVLETLLHEMAHLYNAQREIKDCNVSQYHNEHFKKSAEKFGLKVDKMKGKGWALTHLDQKALDAIEKLEPNVDCYCIVRNPPKRLVKSSKVINIPVDMEYEEEVSYLIGMFESKKELGNEAIKRLYDWFKQTEKESSKILNTLETSD